VTFKTRWLIVSALNLLVVIAVCIQCPFHMAGHTYDTTQVNIREMTNQLVYVKTKWSDR